ncbi:MAG TPA: hypothetical protein VFC78_05365 [Tepidisphaeraceae bacterium]|nr:hypothetical protein [Tepidisphaeraceae bacterium]
MRRRIIRILSLLSLLLCAAVCAMWVLSYWRMAGASWTGSAAIGCEFSRGSFLAGYFKHSTSPTQSERGGEWINTSPEDLTAAPLGVQSTGALGFYIWHGTVFVTRKLHFVIVPCWFLATAFAIPPFIFLIRRRKPPIPGVCRACGYDLRATPDRCPECGAIPAPRPAILQSTKSKATS